MIVTENGRNIATNRTDKAFLKSAEALRTALVEEYQERITALKKMYGITQPMYVELSLKMGLLPEEKGSHCWTGESK